MTLCCDPSQNSTGREAKVSCMSRTSESSCEVCPAQEEVTSRADTQVQRLFNPLEFCFPRADDRQEPEAAHAAFSLCAKKVLVTQSFLTFSPHGLYSPPGSSVPGILQAGILEWVPCLRQGNFPTQGWNPDLPHCGWILYLPSHQGRPLWWRPKFKPTS